MNNISFGSYVPGSSYIYRIDPRIKIIATIILMIAIFVVKNLYAILGAIGLIVILFISARISLLRAIKSLRHILSLSIFIFIFQIIFNRTGDIVYEENLGFSIASIIALVLIVVIWLLTTRFIPIKSLYLILMIALGYISLMYLKDYPSNLYNFDFHIYSKGLNTAIYVLLRLIAVMLIAFILTLTTKPTDLTLALEWLFKPLSAIKINSEEIALIISIALRYIPTILDEAGKIMDAQASRGADFKESNLKGKITQIISLLVPMFVISFEKSDELADAMLSRNYVPGKPKTHYHVLKFKTIDLISFIVSLLILGGAICIRILL